MKHIRSRRLPVLFLCAALLATVCGCGKQAASAVPLDSESLISLEAMYGKSLEEVREEWDIPESGLTERLVGLWYLKKPAVIGEKEFTQAFLLKELFPGNFSGIRFIYHCQSAKELGDLAEALYADFEKAYGPPDNSDFSLDLQLSAEGAFDALRKCGDTEYGVKYGKWNVGESTLAYINIVTWGAEEYFLIELEYREAYIPSPD